LTGVIARNPDFQALAKACGAFAVRVGDAHSLSEAIRDAFNRQTPTLIEAWAPDFA
jgi:thiamine pyrophosphate-dependent acetolactate synthase large subunit-like protein